MQGDQAAEDAMRGGGGQREVIGRRRMQQEGGGRQHEAIGWWVTWREERGELRGPNAAADDTIRGGLDNLRHVACNDLPPYDRYNMVDNLMPLFILHLNS
jgi:hypothetical protein